MPASDEKMRRLLQDAESYLEYALLVRAVHYRMADLRSWLGQVIGGLAVFAAAVVSTGILTHLSINASSALIVAGGVVAFIAAVLAGLQTFYKFGEGAEKHRVAGADYGEVARKLDLFLAQYRGSDDSVIDSALADLATLADKLSDYDRKGPGFPGRLFDRMRQEQDDLRRAAAKHGGRGHLAPPRSLRLFTRRRDSEAAS